MEEIDNIFEFLKKNKLIIIAYILILFLLAGLIYIYFNPKEIKEENHVEILDSNKEEQKENTFFVDIKGAVNAPGTYEVLEGKRIKDVIELAGGLAENANTSVNNLSLKVTDEMSIIIYTNEEVENFTKTKEEEIKKIEECNNSVIRNDSCIIKENTETSNNSLVSINKATKEELMTIPGIGEKRANDIISYREENGPFEVKEDIMKVTGIKESLYDQIESYITT